MDATVGKSKTRRRQRSLKSIQTEQMILTQAKHIFRQVGFEKATTRDIAQAAQVAEGTLFHHFPNKGALLKEVMFDYYDRLQSNAEKIYASEEDAPQRLRALVVDYLEWAQADWEILRIIGQYGRYGDQEFAHAFYQLNKRYTRLFINIFEELKEALYIRRTMSTPLIRDTLFGSIEHFMLGHLGRNRPYDLEKFVDQLLDLLFFGCGGRTVSYGQGAR